MAVPTEVTELAALKEALNSNEEAGGNIEKAAQVVASFTDQQTVLALDKMLAAADGSNDAGTAPEARDAADQLVPQAGMLIGEVTRFLSLPRKSPGKEQIST